MSYIAQKASLVALRSVHLLAAVWFLVTLAHAQSPPPQVRVWEAPLIIPTYELGPPDPNPALADWQRRKKRPVYPYTVLDDLTDRRVNKSYRAVFLENDYLRVTVLPELGGRLYEIFDKTTNRDALYTNHVIKYALVAVRGAWISGGIEWGFLDAHTATTVSPIDYRTQMEADGSAAVTVGDTERVQGMQWAVTIRLRPQTRLVEDEVILNNRRETPGRYWYWSVAAAPAADDLRFAFPVREAYTSSFWPVYSFPREKGVDIGTYREITNAINLYGRDSKRDFFGIYYEKSDRGIVHVADHREMPGKTLWTWGTDDAGKAWINKLTDSDGQYVEFEAGRFETMMEDSLLGPHQVERFTEYWYPVDRLGGSFDQATPDAALRVKTAGRQALVTANFTSHFDDARFTVEAGGERLHYERLNLTPASPFTSVVELPAGAAGKPLTISFRSRDGRTLISYRTDTPVDGNPDFKPATRPARDPALPGSAEQPYVAGLAADKEGRELIARAAYGEALRRDPGFAPAHTALGLSFYRSGEYGRAAEHLLAALRRNKDAADAHYYLGLVRRAEGRKGEAAEQMRWLIRAGGRFESIAHFALGEMALSDNNVTEATNELSQAVRLNPRDVKGRTVLALAERLAGRLDKAQEQVEEAVREMPIDYLALSEQEQVYKARGKQPEATDVHDQLWRLLEREPDSVLDLAFDYSAAGQRTKSQKLLEEAITQARGTNQKIYPMLHYTLGYLYQLSGDQEQALTHYKLGAAGDPALVFPHRVEEIAVLRAAVAANGEDGRAFYYLGNVLAAKERPSEALAAWREAVRLDPGNAVALRNYGLALWKVAGNREEAVSRYEQAIKNAPEEYHRYVELDKLLAEMRETERRIKLLEGAPVGVRMRPAVVQSLAAAYLDARRFSDAVKLLQETTFTSGEGESGALAIYRRAHLGLAHQYQQAGDHREAAREYLKATEYPANLGVGRPLMQSQAREYVAAARQFELAGEQAEAGRLWGRAAEDPLTSPTQPEEPWSEDYYYKALALEHVGRREEAQALYRRLARLADEQQVEEGEASPPEGAIRYVLAGAGLKALGRAAEARMALEKALQLEPNNELARAQLSELEQASGTTRP